MSVRKDQEALSKMLIIAQNYAREGFSEKARRALVCVAAKILQIAENASSTARPILEQKAFNIIRDSVNISARLFDDLIHDLCTDSIGYDIGCDDDNVIGLDAVKRTRRDAVTFDKVIGLDNVKDIINRQIVYPRRYPAIYDRYAKKSGGGILLYGLPGTGKTMIAQAIANEIHAEFISVKCSDILSKWFGESERKIKELFNRAREHRLSIIFFDEFEALASKRGDGSDAMGRLVPELLAEMQGFEDRGNVIIICATNKPWAIDTAFMRPGRLTNRIYVPLPNREARADMFAKKLEYVPFDHDADLGELADLTEGYSGADIEELCDFAKNYAIDREIETGEESILEVADIMSALSHVKSSIHIEDIDDMNRYHGIFNEEQRDEQENMLSVSDDTATP